MEKKKIFTILEDGIKKEYDVILTYKKYFCIRNEKIFIKFSLI